jgi:phospholipid/cholesterol/gamma-HCH transport system permease protein
LKRVISPCTSSLASNQITVAVAGRVTVDSSPHLRSALLHLLRRKAAPVVLIELSGVSYLDMSGLATLLEALKAAREGSVKLRLAGMSGQARALAEIAQLDTIYRSLGIGGRVPLTLLEQVGRAAVVQVEDVGALTMQFWSVLRKLPRVLPVVGARRRWRSAVVQMFAIGASALPMSGAMSLCTGFILALQSASELRKFGALELVVSLVAVGFTRELGPLITALSVSGRSASAISAEIGTMVVTEEIDALRVMGLDPVEITLAPKYLAALITVPCLTILSTLCGIFAGYCVPGLQHGA